MNGFLLDSDVIIWHLRGREETTRMVSELQSAGVPFCSSLSVIEVLMGLKKGEEDPTHLLLESLRVVPVDYQVAASAARLIRTLKRKGITMDIPDAAIAASCLVHGFTLVTYNRKHYPIPDLKIHSCTTLG